jgi:hypothetical protein
MAFAVTHLDSPFFMYPANEPLGKTRVIPDFLPSPPKLAFREEGV